MITVFNKRFYSSQIKGYTITFYFLLAVNYNLSLNFLKIIYIQWKKAIPNLTFCRSLSKSSKKTQVFVIFTQCVTFISGWLQSDL